MNCTRQLKETMRDVFNLYFHPVHYWLELGAQSNSIRGFEDIQMRQLKLFNANFDDVVQAKLINKGWPFSSS